MHVRFPAKSVPLVRPHRQRAGLLKVEMVTLVMRFFFTSMLQRTASLPASASICNLLTPTFWRRSAVPFLIGSSLTKLR